MPTDTSVCVSPSWAATWRPGFSDPRLHLCSSDMALAMLVAGRWAEYDPCPDGEASDAVEHLRRMRDGEPDTRAVVRIPMLDVTSGLGMRNFGTPDDIATRARSLTNGGLPCYADVRFDGERLLFAIAPNRAVVLAHRRFGRTLRGRGGRALLSDHAYAGLEPALMARFRTSMSSPVYARTRSWLHSPGDAGLPAKGVEQSEDGLRLKLTLPVSDAPKVLGLWARMRPSKLDGALQHVALDLSDVGYHLGHEISAVHGKVLDTVTIILASVPKSEEKVPPEPDALGIVRPSPERVGRFRAVTAKARRAAAAATAAAASAPMVMPTVAPASPARPRRVAAAIVPVEQPASVAPTVEPEPTTVLAAPEPMPEPATVAPVQQPAAVERALPASTAHDAEPWDGIDRFPDDGWGWKRHKETLVDTSEGLARLEFEHEVFAPGYPAPPSRDPLADPLPIPVAYGVSDGPDLRPTWLVRHLPYRVKWWPGGWSDRPVTFHPTLMGRLDEPFAIWAPGMGAQPAHVSSLGQLQDFMAKAERRRRWIEIRQEREHFVAEFGADPDDDVAVREMSARYGYAALDAEFDDVGQERERWDAHLVEPTGMTLWDEAYSRRVAQHRRDVAAAQVASRLAAARPGAFVAQAAR